MTIRYLFHSETKINTNEMAFIHRDKKIHGLKLDFIYTKSKQSHAEEIMAREERFEPGKKLI